VVGGSTLYAIDKDTGLAVSINNVTLNRVPVRLDRVVARPVPITDVPGAAPSLLATIFVSSAQRRLATMNGATGVVTPVSTTLAYNPRCELVCRGGGHAGGPLGGFGGGGGVLCLGISCVKGLGCCICGGVMCMGVSCVGLL
jgi:hypothetical protein